MGKLNIYKKIQIVLLILIIILLAIFIVSVKNRKIIETSLIEPTSSQLEDIKDNQEKNESEEMIVGIDEIQETEGDTSWDEQDVEDTQVDVTDKEQNEKDNSLNYYIKINYTANCVTIYSKDSSGKYTVPVKAMVCSTGTDTPTSGVYKMTNKYRWHLLNGGVYGQYCSRITGHILFHSVPYATNSNDALKYTAYDKLGTKASAGCIRLTVIDAMWIYSNCPSGTYVEFYSSSNPGPLGKPSAQKISSNIECRNWDPTDPDNRNPWHTYKEPVEEQPQVPIQPEPEAPKPAPNPTPVQPEIPSTSTGDNKQDVPKDNTVQNNTNDNRTENNTSSKNEVPNGNTTKNEASSGNTTVNESTDDNNTTNESINDNTIVEENSNNNSTNKEKN